MAPEPSHCIHNYPFPQLFHVILFLVSAMTPPIIQRRSARAAAKAHPPPFSRAKGSWKTSPTKSDKAKGSWKTSPTKSDNGSIIPKHSPAPTCYDSEDSAFDWSHPWSLEFSAKCRAVSLARASLDPRVDLQELSQERDNSNTDIDVIVADPPTPCCAGKKHCKFTSKEAFCEFDECPACMRMFHVLYCEQEWPVPDPDGTMDFTFVCAKCYHSKSPPKGVTKHSPEVVWEVWH